MSLVPAQATDQARTAITNALDVLDQVRRLGHDLRRLESTVDTLAKDPDDDTRPPAVVNARFAEMHEAAGTRALRDVIGGIQHITVDALGGYGTELSWEQQREIRARWT